MKLSKDQVLHVAQLARLGLTSQEIITFQTQLSSILDYVEQLNEVNTDGIEPTAQVTGLVNVMREDHVMPNVLADPDELLKCSPLPKEKRQIKVKRVLNF